MNPNQKFDPMWFKKVSYPTQGLTAKELLDQIRHTERLRQAQAYSKADIEATLAIGNTMYTDMVDVPYYNPKPPTPMEELDLNTFLDEVG